MPVTFVTAFIDLGEDRSKDKSVDTCFTLFKQLAKTGITLHLFLSPSYSETYTRIVGAPENVKVTFLELSDLETYRELVGLEYKLPVIRTPHHDTKNFMILMNSKIEFVHRAAAMGESSHYAWIDFSIFHVFRDPVGSAAYLRMLGASSLQDTCLAFPGCWQKGANFSAVNWRFCGGFFLGDKASLETMYEMYRTHFKRIVQLSGLTWEVNMWAYLEYTVGWSPTWFLADHNDSIVRIPGDTFRVVASLTTIPPRVESCRLAIDSLLGQVDHIYLSVASTYMRFGDWIVPSYLQEEPYHSKVTVVLTEDRGPATKYVGALASIPDKPWMFICDDDQEYHPTLLDRMKAGIKDYAVYQNHYESIRQKTSGGLIHGYVGLLVHSTALDAMPDFPLPPSAYFVDDQWMSIYCYLRCIRVRPTTAETYQQIYKVLDGWHEKLGVDSLAGLHNRADKVREIEEFFGVEFTAGGGVTVRNKFEGCVGGNYKLPS